MALLASALQPIVDAAWFGLARPAHEGARWVSLALAAGVVYTAVRLAGPALAGWLPAAAGRWLRSYVTFLGLLYWILGLHFVLLVEGGWDPAAADALLLPAAELLILATLCAVLWPLAFDIQPWRGAAKGVFGCAVALLLAYLLIREPELAHRALVRAGIVGVPMEWVYGELFARESPYLAPLVPVFWSLWRSWRERRGSGPG